MDNVTSIKPPPFTILNLSQVIWASVNDEQIVVKVLGEDKPIKVIKEDGLFNHYKLELIKLKNEMQGKQFT